MDVRAHRRRKPCGTEVVFYRVDVDGVGHTWPVSMRGRGRDADEAKQRDRQDKAGP